MNKNELQELLELLDDSVQVADGKAVILDGEKLKANIFRLAEVSALGTGPRQGYARYLTRLIAIAHGVYPASIHEMYMARGRGEIPSNFTVPAINLRALSFDAAKAVFRAAETLQAGPILFEIARSEMGYTSQNPAEYSTNILAAAISEGYSGPVFIQGDHFQVSPKRYGTDPETELQALRDLIQEAIGAGFYNIDVDTSTLVDLSVESIPDQQSLNIDLSAMFTNYIRPLEPDGVTISVGGEIGEVGGHNSTEEELRAYMDGFNEKLAELDNRAVGLSKISIQTGTSHGGVVLPDGSIARVSVDFDTLLRLSRVARDDYGMAGAVQHGASTLPEDAFGKFTESEACEVHLATNFQNMLFDRLPENLRDEMYVYLDENHNDERKPDMTDEQFYYKTRKRVIGAFKAQTWDLPAEKKDEICSAWEAQFGKLFELLGLTNTRNYVEQTITPVLITPELNYYLKLETDEEDVSDLAD